ncbi:MAG: butyrate kinase, partial [bacterium]
GLAHSDTFCDWVTERVAFLGPVFRFPGAFEMEALALGALRVLRGEEEALTYPPEAVP